MPELTYGGRPLYYNGHQKYRDMLVHAGFDYKLLFGCTINILMVTDVSHYTDSNGYHLSEVIKAIQSNLPKYLTINITTAGHHSGSNASGADINNFNFTDPVTDSNGKTIKLSQKYDQIWFFAVRSFNGTHGLTDTEVEKVYEFMQDGGGIFATGDHADLGASLCGRIPRVRSMRRWWDDGDGPQGEPDAPPPFGPGQHDTAIGNDFDGTPQTIKPKKYSSASIYALQRWVYPHPVLCGPEGPITVLPDHMHEGQIEVPNLNAPFTVNGNSITEYPKRGSQKLPPEVIATATNQRDGQPFGVIGAYDGHRVDEVSGGVGRIVVDATWHHFFNMNVNQFRLGFEAVNTALDNGQTPNPADVVLADHYRPMRAYFQNIAIWLANKNVQACIRRRGLWVVRWHIDLQMALIPRARLERIALPLEYYLDLGRKAKDAFQRMAPQCETLKYILHVIPELELRHVLDPWVIDPDFQGKQREAGLPRTLCPDMTQTVMLGAAIQAIADEFGEDMDEKRMDGGEMDKVLQQGAMTAIRNIREVAEADAKSLDRLTKGYK